jgi:hypothetical protein
MSVPISNIALLTGAGFTCDFGGYLADEMWSLIFSHPKIQDNKHIRQLMLRDFNYESIYHAILYTNSMPLQHEEWREDDRQAIKSAMIDTYWKLDQSIYNNRYTFARDFQTLNRFIGKFFTPGKTSYFFTLNQDIFVERIYGLFGNDIELPAIRKVPSPRTND